MTVDFWSCILVARGEHLRRLRPIINGCFDEKLTKVARSCRQRFTGSVPLNRPTCSRGHFPAGPPCAFPCILAGLAEIISLLGMCGLMCLTTYCPYSAVAFCGNWWQGSCASISRSIYPQIPNLIVGTGWDPSWMLPHNCKHFMVRS